MKVLTPTEKHLTTKIYRDYTVEVDKLLPTFRISLKIL